MGLPKISTFWKAVIVIVLFWFFFKGKMGEITMDRVNFYAIVAFLGWGSITAFDTLEKYKTRHLVVNGVQGSCFENPYTVGNYVIYRLGGSRYLSNGDDCTVIAPRRMHRQIGENFYNVARVMKKPFSCLPYEVREAMRAFKMNLDDVWFGVATEHTEVKNPDSITEEILQERRNDMVSLYDDMFKGKIDSVERYNSFAARTLERAGKKETIFEKIFKKDDSRPPPEQ